MPAESPIYLQTNCFKNSYAKGVKLGRPYGAGKSRLDPHKEEIVALLKVRAEKKFIAKKFSVTPPTLKNWIKKNGIEVKGV